MSAQDVGKILGGKKILERDITSNRDLISLIRRGLPVRAVRFLIQETSFTQEEVTVALNIPRRTFLRRMKEKDRLDQSESEKILRFARVFGVAKEALDNDSEKAGEWMRRPNRALGNVPPIALLDSDLGAQQVEDVLGRLQEGVFS